MVPNPDTCTPGDEPSVISIEGPCALSVGFIVVSDIEVCGSEGRVIVVLDNKGEIVGTDPGGMLSPPPPGP